MSKTDRNYTVGERALIFIAAAADIPLDELNAVLAADAARAKGIPVLAHLSNGWQFC